MNLEIVKVRKDETSSHLIEVLGWGGFEIDTIKSKHAPFGAVFLPASVLKDGRKIWTFQGFRPDGYRGMAKLTDFEGELLVYLATRQTLDVVVPVRDMPHLVKMGSNWIGGRDDAELIRIKTEIADKLGLIPNWTLFEKDFIAMMDARVEREKATKHAEARAVLAEEERQRQLAHDQRQAERAQRREAIMNRPRFTAYTVSGDPRNGQPVVDDEWMCLKNGTSCILVDAEGNPKEHFFVKKTSGGRPSRGVLVSVSGENPKTNGGIGKGEILPELPFRGIEVHGKLRRAFIAPDLATVDIFVRAGVNSGTLITAPEKEGSERCSVFSLEGGTRRLIGTCNRVK